MDCIGSNRAGASCTSRNAQRLGTALLACRVPPCPAFCAAIASPCTSPPTHTSHLLGTCTVQWEQQWGAECSSMLFELPHFALELLVVLPCVQVGKLITARMVWL